MTVEAPSGGGKTRLLDEVVGRAVEEGLWVLRGGAVDQAAAQPFQLLGGVVREVVRAASADAVLHEKLTGRLGDEAVAASAAMPELAEIVGARDEVGLGPEQHAEARSIRALAALLDALGAPGREALVILDDAQWADEVSLRLLAAWAQRAAPDRRTLLIVAFREEEVAADHALRTAGAREHLRLPPMAAAEVASLATTMAGTLPPEALDAVERLSDGNPFMATAVLRGLVESAALRRERDGWRVSRAALADVSSSRAAADVLLARVDMLPGATLALLTAGAVLGKAFEIALAAELAAQDPADAIASLAEARRRNIVWTDQEESQVTFVHDKLREALLARVEPEELRALHRAAARRIEAAHPDMAFELAYHYDAGGERDRAVPHAMRAAAIARGRHALAAAESHYRIALAARGAPGRGGAPGAGERPGRRPDDERRLRGGPGPPRAGARRCPTTRSRRRRSTGASASWSSSAATWRRRSRRTSAACACSTSACRAGWAASCARRSARWRCRRGTRSPPGWRWAAATPSRRRAARCSPCGSTAVSPTRTGSAGARCRRCGRTCAG